MLAIEMVQRLLASSSMHLSAIEEEVAECSRGQRIVRSWLYSCLWNLREHNHSTKATEGISKVIIPLCVKAHSCCIVTCYDRTYNQLEPRQFRNLRELTNMFFTSAAAAEASFSTHKSRKS